MPFSLFLRRSSDLDLGSAIDQFQDRNFNDDYDDDISAEDLGIKDDILKQSAINAHLMNSDDVEATNRYINRNPNLVQSDVAKNADHMEIEGNISREWTTDETMPLKESTFTNDGHFDVQVKVENAEISVNAQSVNDENGRRGGDLLISQTDSPDYNSNDDLITCLEMKAIRCPACNIHCSSDNHLKVHLMNKHPNKDLPADRDKSNRRTKYSCKFCGMIYLDYRVFKKHEKRHLANDSLECYVCKKVCRTKNDFKAHFLCHTGEKPYGCDVCDKKYNSLSTLRNHKRIHSGLKPFQCDTCKKRFGRKSHLNDHLVTHSTENNFHCDVCKSTFKHRNSLKKHERNNPTCSKPYVCNVCGFHFTRQRELKQHQREDHL